MKTAHWFNYDVDVAGVGLLVLVTLGGYALAIHRPLSDSLGYDQAERQREAMSATLASMQADLASTRNLINQTNRHLSNTGVRLPDSHAVDDLISRLHDLASQCGVLLTRFQPMATAKRPGYQVRSFIMEGRATFPAIHRWFALVESGVPYLDVTHFSIRASKNHGPEKAVCLFECTQKYYVRDSDTSPTALARRP